MNISNEAKAILKELEAIDDDVEITFKKDEITIYWENLRVDCESKDLTAALQSIKKLIGLSAHFQ